MLSGASQETSQDSAHPAPYSCYEGTQAKPNLAVRAERVRAQGVRH